MTYVYASRMGKTEKLIEKLAIDAMKIENGTETVKGDYILFTYTDGNGVVPNIVESFLENNPDGCSRRKQRAPCRNLWLGGGYHLRKIQCSLSLQGRW